MNQDSDVLENLKKLKSFIENPTSKIDLPTAVAGYLSAKIQYDLNLQLDCLNSNLSKTFQNIRHLQNEIERSRQEIIASNERLSKSQSWLTGILCVLTFALVVVGFLQYSTMKQQMEVMKETTEFGYRPVLAITPHAARYGDRGLIFDYVLDNYGKSRVLNIERCHSLDVIDRIQKVRLEQIKSNTCVSNEFDKSINPGDSSLIHNDDIGNYKLANYGPEKYFQLHLTVKYKPERNLKSDCVVSRSFNLFPIANSDKQMVVQPLSPTMPECP